MRYFVRAVIKDPDDRVLVLKHAGGLWNLPGGKVEFGETAEVAIVREVLEELGVLMVDWTRLANRQITLGGQEWQGAFFVVTTIQGIPFNRDASKHSCLSWIHVTSLPLLDAHPDLLANVLIGLPGYKIPAVFIRNGLDLQFDESADDMLRRVGFRPASIGY